MKWPLIKLEEVALPIKGSIVSGPFGSNIGSRFFVDVGVPVIRGGNLTFGYQKFIDEGFVFLSEEKAREFVKCEAVVGDVIFTAAGTIGQVGIIPADCQFDRYIISNKQLRIRCDPAKVVPYFIFLWFTLPEMRRHIIGKNSGSTIPLINLGILRGLPLPLPPLNTQKRIAEFISAYDDLIENNRRRMALLEQSARLLYEEWFVRLRFPGHEHTRIFEGAPSGWSKIPLDDVLILQRGFDLPSQDRIDGDIPIYGASGINGRHNLARVTGPGIVTGRAGSLGTVHFVPGDFWPLNTSLWVKEFRLATPLFALHLLRAMKLERYGQGATMPMLDRKVVHKVEVLIPPSSVMRMFESFAADIQRQIQTLELNSEKLRAARDLLLPRLMSGELAA